MKKTLIIHPKDESTFFLDIVYNPIPNKTVITGGVTKDELVELIKTHDRVMMMGHGSPYGLFSIGQFTNTNYGNYIIDHTLVSYLNEKDDNVFIWCNADQFVNRHGLKGFFSGMFISEVSEAGYCKVYGTDQEIVDESNYGFCNIVAKHINETKEVIYENVMKEYGLIAENNPVAFYNHNRLYLNI
jgi:hypothetical protein